MSLVKTVGQMAADTLNAYILGRFESGSQLTDSHKIFYQSLFNNVFITTQLFSATFLER